MRAWKSKFLGKMLNSCKNTPSDIVEYANNAANMLTADAKDTEPGSLGGFLLERHEVLDWGIVLSSKRMLSNMAKVNEGSGVYYNMMMTDGQFKRTEARYLRFHPRM